LKLTIAATPASFRFLVATFNSPHIRESVIERLSRELEESGIRVARISADAMRESRSLLAAVEKQFVENPETATGPGALMVLGAGDVFRGATGADELRGFFETANVQRDVFPTVCPCPLTLWLTPSETSLLGKRAPDLWHWRAGVFDFSLPAEALIETELAQWPSSRTEILALPKEDKKVRVKTLQRLLGEISELSDPDRSDERILAAKASLLHRLGSARLDVGKMKQARQNFEQALKIQRAINESAGEAATLHQLASIDLDEGNYGAARDLFGKALGIRQVIGDRAGEAAALHQLASIDLTEGNYGPARDLFGKALGICQEIGDRAGEAATFYQIGAFALGQRRYDVGIRLIAICHWIEASIGSGSIKETAQGLEAMKLKLKLTESEVKAILREAQEAYQRDRGASLVAAAFEDSGPPV
jgi:tetratricopeptide (TPR) repeat protein